MSDLDRRNPGDLDEELAGLDALEAPPLAERFGLHKLSQWTWPLASAMAIVILAWQVVVWSEWRPTYLLPGPLEVFGRLWKDLTAGDLPTAVSITLRRAVIGYGVATLVGALIGGAVARVNVLRRAIGSLITGLQTMPSIAWFPLAILLFQLSEAAILFVVVLGAAPAIANGIIAGVDHVPPLLVRAGRVLGARGWFSIRHVVLPAALPSVVSGLKQGWAFAWRSLMAGELLVIIANRPSIGSRLQFAREFSDAEGLISLMIVVLIIGIFVDEVIFSTISRVVRRRRGLLESAA